MTDNQRMTFGGRRLRWTALAIAFGLALGMATALLPAAAASEVGELSGQRVAGQNRYETSALLASRFGTFTNLVIANGEQRKGGFDALAGNYLAGQIGAPLLLTQSDVLAPATLRAICSGLGTEAGTQHTIYILGGEDSISRDVESRLRRPCDSGVGDISVVRVSGADRYDTSAEIARQSYQSPVGETSVDGGESRPTAILASGQVAADALSAGSMSARYRYPILLTTPGALLPSVSDAISSLKIGHIIALGGPDRISDKLVATLEAKGLIVIRVAGRDRFETSVRVAETQDGLRAGQSAPNSQGILVALANGLTGFSDALSVGPYLARTDGRLLLVPSVGLPQAAKSYLSKQRGSIQMVMALGKAASVSESTLSIANSAAGVAPSVNQVTCPVGNVTVSLSGVTVRDPYPTVADLDGRFSVEGTFILTVSNNTNLAIDFSSIMLYLGHPGMVSTLATTSGATVSPGSSTTVTTWPVQMRSDQWNAAGSWALSPVVSGTVFYLGVPAGCTKKYGFDFVASPMTIPNVTIRR